MPLQLNGLRCLGGFCNAVKDLVGIWSGAEGGRVEGGCCLFRNKLAGYMPWNAHSRPVFFRIGEIGSMCGEWAAFFMETVKRYVYMAVAGR